MVGYTTMVELIDGGSMAETTIQVKTDGKTKTRAISLAKKAERDLSKEIRYLINKEFDRVFPDDTDAVDSTSGVADVDTQD